MQREVESYPNARVYRIHEIKRTTENDRERTGRRGMFSRESTISRKRKLKKKKKGKKKKKKRRKKRRKKRKKRKRERSRD